MDASAFTSLPVNAPGVVAFNLERDLVWLLQQALIFGLAVAFVFTGLAARLKRWVVDRTSGVYQFTVVVFVAIAATALMIIDLPLSYWLNVVHQPAGEAPALTDWLFGQGITLISYAAYAVVAALLLPILATVLPKRWWILVAVVAAPVLAYNIMNSTPSDASADIKFVPIESEAVASLLARCGARGLSVAIGGGKTHIEGTGADARILIAGPDATRLTDTQFLGAVARELKHNLTQDTWVQVGVAVILFSGGAFIVYTLGAALVARFGPRIGLTKTPWGVYPLEDVVALPLLFALAGLYWTFIGVPGLNAMKRSAVFEADRFAIEITHAGDALAAWQAGVAKADPARLVDYNVLYTYLRATEPSDADRIALANTYKPWTENKPGSYDDLCKPAKP